MRSLIIPALLATVTLWSATATPACAAGGSGIMKADTNARQNVANTNTDEKVRAYEEAVAKMQKAFTDPAFVQSLVEKQKQRHQTDGLEAPPKQRANSKKKSTYGDDEGKDFWDICDQVTTLGFACEHHTSVTEDGFELDIIRVPPQPGHLQDPHLISQYGNGNGYPMLLQHGLIDSASCWVANYFPSQNLGTMLSAAGYDVFMPNARGNHYSEGNTKYSKSDDEYWQRIDMDFMAKYDMPANINYVLNFTRHSTLSYVGHSQGGMMGFGAFSTWRPDLAPKVDYFFALAPACYVYHTSSLAVKALADLDVAQWIQLFGVHEFLDNSAMEWVITQICPIVGIACALLLDVFCGPSTQINTTQLATITRYTPGGTSVNNMLHWAQEVRTDAWATHDFGAALNQKYWGQPTNPAYTANAMQGPKTVVFYGEEDALADPTDVETLLSQVPAATVLASHKMAGYAHLDFTWGVNAHKDIYPTIMTYLSNITRKK